MRRSHRVDLPVVHVSAIEAADGPHWLIKDLWAEEGVGIVGGNPKCGKTWLAMDLALSVASGTAALERYPVVKPGPALIFAAEDRPPMVRARLEGLAQRRGVSLKSFPINVILETRLRLDMSEDQERLVAAVEQYAPRILILDPFVRLQRIDENSSLEVAGVLSYLRELQRRHHVSIVVVHHARKAGGARDQPGITLRGSGDFWAWGDSNLFLCRRNGALELVIEHRNARAPDPVQLRLENDPPHLEVTCTASKDEGLADLKERILEFLRACQQAVRQQTLRDQLRVRTQRLTQAMRELRDEQRIVRAADGWTTVNHQETGRSGGRGGDTPAEE